MSFYMNYRPKQDVPDKGQTNLYKSGIFVYNVRIFQGD